MDYVLFGIGYGATLMLLGWALRTFGPSQKYASVQPHETEAYRNRQHWEHFVQGLGGIIAIAGTSLVTLTFIIMLINPDDATGQMTAYVIWGAILLSLLWWCWAYIARFGLRGIWSREDGYGFQPRQNPAPLRTESRRQQSSRERSATRETPVVSRPIVLADRENRDIGIDEHGDATDGEIADPEIHDTEMLDTVSRENTPEYDFGDGNDTTVPAEVRETPAAAPRMAMRRDLIDRIPE